MNPQRRNEKLDPTENIFVTELCTSCDVDRLFRYRREANRSGRLMAVIAIRP